MLEWVAISYSRGSSQPRDRNCLSCICFIGRRILYHWHPLYVFYPCFPIENERAGGNGEGEETSFGAHQVPSTVSGTWQFAQAFQPWPVGKGNGSHLFEKILIFDNGVKHNYTWWGACQHHHVFSESVPSFWSGRPLSSLHCFHNALSLSTVPFHSSQPHPQPSSTFQDLLRHRPQESFPDSLLSNSIWLGSHVHRPLGPHLSPLCCNTLFFSSLSHCELLEDRHWFMFASLASIG